MDVQGEEVVDNLSGDGSCSSEKVGTLVQSEQSLHFRVVNLLEDFEHGGLSLLSVALKAHFLGLPPNLLFQTLDISGLLQHFLPHSGDTKESGWFAPAQIVEETSFHDVLV